MKLIDLNLNIRYLGDPVLRKKAEKIDKFDDNLKELMPEFIKQMYKLDGVGLAAPQLGIAKAFFVMDDGESFRVVINPEIKSFFGENKRLEEGCLSVPGIYADIERPEGIKVVYQNEEGKIIEEELHENASRIFQHEYDHLEGILFTDKLSVVQKAKIKKQLLKITKDGKKISKELGEIVI